MAVAICEGPRLSSCIEIIKLPEREYFSSARENAIRERNERE